MTFSIETTPNATFSQLNVGDIIKAGNGYFYKDATVAEIKTTKTGRIKVLVFSEMRNGDSAHEVTNAAVSGSTMIYG